MFTHELERQRRDYFFRLFTGALAPVGFYIDAHAIMGQTLQQIMLDACASSDNSVSL
jgi:hypothetical protein